MARLVDLNVRQLKRELEARNLITKGNKSKLQARLLRAMETNGENGEEHEFTSVLSRNDNVLQALIGSNEDTQTTAPLEMNALLAAIAGVQDSLMENTTQVEDMQQRIEDNLAKNSTQLEERIHDNATQLEERMQQNALKMEERAFADLAKLREGLTVHLKKLEEKVTGIEALTVQLKERQAQLEREWQKSHAEIKSEFKATDKNVERDKPDKNDCKREIFDYNPPKATETLDLSPPIFDGTMSISIFKLQFEMAVKFYKWNNEERLAALVLALKGPTASILQTFTDTPNPTYEAVMAALERKYSSEHWLQIHKMQSVTRAQKHNEPLLDYANEIERLTHLAYTNVSNDFLEYIKIQNFIRGLRDCDIKVAMYSMPKPTFIETLAYAITQEAALNLAKPKYYCEDIGSSNLERSRKGANHHK
ncbi:uncharacterized protein LOC105214729 isoform X1 [Zeugodacus cucurbitae]|uniref:Scaffold attachment factor B1 n=1 Tax=Zeugodacus cucurbitae TaxID=28588 RepID=A0A0A1WD72_ZEUCU|nr:uncharacterized protein LOC105214729 isoform X1 [Zeugodacus cucurbitae]